MNADERSLTNMAIQRARNFDYKAPHEIRQDLLIFKKYNIMMSADVLASMEALLPKLVAHSKITRQTAKRRQASARAGRAIKKGPKIKVPKDEGRKGGRGR